MTQVQDQEHWLLWFVISFFTTRRDRKMTQSVRRRGELFTSKRSPGDYHILGHSKLEGMTSSQLPEDFLWSIVNLSSVHTVVYLRCRISPPVTVTFALTKETENYHNGCETTFKNGWLNRYQKTQRRIISVGCETLKKNMNMKVQLCATLLRAFMHVNIYTLTSCPLTVSQRGAEHQTFAFILAFY